MRRSTQSEKVLKSISIALAAMVTSTTVMGSMGTMTVYAAEEVEDHGFDAIDENAGKYQDTETSGAASVAEMNESVEDAKEALDNVNDLVTEINNELEKAENAAKNATEAGKDATAAAKDATEAADDAQEAVNGDASTKKDDATERADAVLEETNKYNDLVNDGNTENDNISDQEAVNAAVETIEITETETETENGTKKVTDVAVTVITEDGQETTENLNAYVSEKAVEAEEAKKEAYNALKDALAVETREVNDEVREKVAAVEAAADKAQQAADDAKEVYDNAKGSYDKALAEYNYYAMLHGLALYDGTTDYGEEELNEVGITLDAGKAEKEGLILARSQQKQDITDDTKELKDDLADAEKELAKQSETIQKQEEALGAASDNLANAEKAADEAQAAVELALNGRDVNKNGNKEEEGDEKGIVDFVDKAEEASRTTTKYFSDNTVNPAIAAEAAAKKIMEEKKAALDDATKDKSDDIISNASEIVNEANEKTGLVTNLEWQQFLSEHGTKKQKTAAKAYINRYNEAKAIKEAQDAYNEADREYEAAKKAKEEFKSIVEAVNLETRNAEVTAIKEAIDKELKGLSVDVNQVEFDRDLNEWANNLIRVVEESNGVLDAIGNVVEAYKVRDFMDNNYEIGRLNEILNTLAITQGLVSTEETEKIMATAIEAYRAAMKTDEEKLATVNAYYAYLQAAKQQGVAENALTDINTYISSVKTAQTALETAQTNLNIAKDNYDTAAANLKDAKDKLANLELNDIELGKLEKKILEAQGALEDAAMKLEEAQDSAFTAQVYKQWAENLINPQEARCYVNILEDKTGIDDSDKNVTSRPSKNYENVSPIVDNKVVKQIVPYELYKQYVSWLMKDRTETSQIKNANLPTGKGIATGENGSLGIVYWETDENGKIKLDENGQAIFHYDGENLAAGRYFVAYVFKHESDGYHFDGVYVDVEENKQPELPPEVTDGEDDPSPTTVIDDQPVALAASVLGAERARTVENADEQIMVDQNGDVLGADRTPTGDVLGAGRPQTGDYTNTGIALFGAVASGMMLLGYGLKKKKEDEAEEC